MTFLLPGDLQRYWRERLGGIVRLLQRSRAAGVKKPSGNPKAKAIRKMKAAKDNKEDFYDPERKDNIL